MSSFRLTVIATLAIALICTVQAGSKCHGISFNGGGDRGSYEAGVINGLIDNLDGEDIQWDVVSGISAGALNSVPFAVFPVGQEKQIGQLVHDMWFNLTSSNVYENWDFGILEGLLFKNGLVNTTPERQLLEKILEEYGSHQQRDVFVGASDLSHGQFAQFHNMELDKESFINAVMSSSAAPGVLQTQTWNNGTTYGDGGGFFKTNFNPLIEGCKEKGFSDEDIIIDMVFSYHHELAPMPDVKDLSPLKLLGRYFSLIMVEWYNHYIPQAQRAYPNINWRYLVMPSKKLPDGKIPLFFKHDQIVEMFNIGHQDAADVINMGEGTAFQLAFDKATTALNAEMEQLLA